MRVHPRLAFTAALALASCHRAPPKADSPAPSASVAEAPLDRLAPGELQPGTEALFGLTLPKGMRVVAAFQGVAHAVGKVTPEDVANYVRDRVDTKRVELAPSATIFPSTHVVGGDRTRTYRIEVTATETGTELIVRDVTPVPERRADPNVPVEERWKRAGLRSDGTPLDPMNLR